MNRLTAKACALLLGTMLLGGLAACSDDAAPGTRSASAGKPGSAGPAANGGVAGAAAGSGVHAAAGGSAAGGAGAASILPPDDGCSKNQTFKEEGCPCRTGETAACWTGPAADRNVGACHDGLQVCAGGEFATWGACMGEELVCGTDAGVPPPPPEGACPCIPGSVIQCSEDCSVGIICSLTASKTCLPDGTWSTCREDLGVTLDLPGVQCRNMLHGCFPSLPGESTVQGQGEIYVGDCSKQFECGQAPPPPTVPTPTEPAPTEPTPGELPE